MRFLQTWFGGDRRRGRVSTRLLALEALESRDVPAILWQINTAADTNDANLFDGVPLDANGKVSLRAAVQQANKDMNPAGYQIAVEIPPNNLPVIGENPPPPPPLPTYVIQLVRAMDPFKADIAVTGSGANLTILGGADSKGMFKIMAESTSSFSYLKMQGGLNHATGGGSGTGGAIEVLGRLTMTAVRVQGCTADDGGAIYTNNRLTLVNCDIVQNSTTLQNLGRGGGILGSGTSVINIQLSRITGNTAISRGGGVGLINNAQATLQDTEVTDNRAVNGGGIYNSGTTFSMSGGRLQDNRSDADGAGMLQSGGTATLQNVTVKGNIATGSGGGFAIDGGTFSVSGGTVEYNRAVNGAGFYQQGGTASFQSVEILSNTASEWGGATYISGGTLTFTTCAFAGNAANTDGPKIAKKANTNPTITVMPDCTGIDPNNDIIIAP